MQFIKVLDNACIPTLSQFYQKDLNIILLSAKWLLKAIAPTCAFKDGPSSNYLLLFKFFRKQLECVKPKCFKLGTTNNVSRLFLKELPTLRLFLKITNPNHCQQHRLILTLVRNAHTWVGRRVTR